MPLSDDNNSRSSTSFASGKIMTRSKAINKSWLVAEKHVVVEKIKATRKANKRDSAYKY